MQNRLEVPFHQARQENINIKYKNNESPERVYKASDQEMFEERTAYGKSGQPVRHLSLNDRLTLSTSGQWFQKDLPNPPISVRAAAKRGPAIVSSGMTRDREDSHHWHRLTCEHRRAEFGGGDVCLCTEFYNPI